MRTICTDVLMICKGWGTTAFESREEALENYIKTITCDDSISALCVVHFLTRAVKKFISLDKVLDALQATAEDVSIKSLHPIYWIIDLYINLLSDRDITDLDLEDYKEIKEYCEKNHSILVTPWWKQFKSKLKDDRR